MFDDLPLETIDQIVCWSAPDVGSSLRKWKNALRLLSVSATWRAAGINRIYRNAFVADIKDYRFKDKLDRIAEYRAQPGTRPTPTNVNLIERLGLLPGVRRVIVNGKRDCDGFSVLAHVINTLAVTASECPGADGIKRCSPSEFTDYNVRSDFEKKCYKAIVALAAALHRKFPHARTLKIDTFGFCNTLAVFSAEVLQQYVAQLSGFTYRGIAYYPTPLLDHNLTHLDLSLHRFHNEPMLVLRPHKLKSLCLHLGNIAFDWSMFRADNDDAADSKPIVFDELKCLSITGDDRAVKSTHWHWPSAHFPKLTTLCVSNCMFSSDDIKWLLKCPLKHLELIQSHESALEFLNHDLSQLRELKLAHFDTHQQDSHFIEQTNLIFGKTRNIGRVRCELFSHCELFESTDLHWQYLTHMKIHQLDGLANILLSTRKTPNLVELEAWFRISDVAIDDREGGFTADFDTKKPLLKDSKLEKISLAFDGAKYTSKFTEELERLKLFFPRLKIVNWSD
ncbi:hypothetical protein LPJ70_000864 [Coemansia sp. RSA 2708]|nr:hypothetical protein LPJ70_000864 [Coemansia sp. RSA 2708]KAJ2310789.1 hypothetical protein IWW54_003000 [Coemansia sp. RSA 2705]KAJ2326638.1 hypothetical protein IWW51_002168 [Coemansia sp. RSA 2702]